MTWGAKAFLSAESRRAEAEAERGDHGFTKTLSEKRRVRIRQPRLRAVIPLAHGAGGDRTLEAAHRDLSARRGRRPEHGGPVWRGRLLSRAAEHRDSAPERRERRSGSRRVFRIQPAPPGVEAALGSPPA